MGKKLVDEIKDVVKSRKKKKSKIAELADEEYKNLCASRDNGVDIGYISSQMQQMYEKINKRIDRIVNAIDNAKRVKGL